MCVEATRGLSDCSAHLMFYENCFVIGMLLDLETSPVNNSDDLAKKFWIYDSPENLYFQAPFLACLDAPTEYCFVQVSLGFGTQYATDSFLWSIVLSLGIVG